jgi:sorbitol-specific phosphotransferase system component IIBC
MLKFPGIFHSDIKSENIYLFDELCDGSGTESEEVLEEREVKEEDLTKPSNENDNESVELSMTMITMTGPLIATTRRAVAVT